MYKKIWIYRINGVATKSLNTKLLPSSRTKYRFVNVH